VFSFVIEILVLKRLFPSFDKGINSKSHSKHSKARMDFDIDGTAQVTGARTTPKLIKPFELTKLTREPAELVKQ
jgi:hypothetical protein